MYILDTCTLNILLVSSPTKQANLRAKLETVDDNDVWISVVSVQEILIEGIAKEIKNRIRRNDPKISLAYNGLIKFLDQLRDYQILPYTDKDNEYFKNIPAKVKRQGPNDCRIAASAVNNGFIVVTQNTDDFEDAGATCQDWTVRAAT